MITADLLRRLRNDLPMPVTIAALGREGPPAEMSEGYFRFLCPHCGEMRATVNPKNNLAHCFYCKKNLNNIDLLLTLDYDFRAAVNLLEGWLNRYEARQAKQKVTTPPDRRYRQMKRPALAGLNLNYRAISRLYSRLGYRCHHWPNGEGYSLPSSQYILSDGMEFVRFFTPFDVTRVLSAATSSNLLKPERASRNLSETRSP